MDEVEEGVPGIRPGVILADRYEIVRLLGQGGMGAVFEAKHKTIGRRVAVKLLRPEVAMNPGIVQRFLQEARAANEVRHKNIVEVSDFGVDQGKPYLVMEFLEGEPLTSWLERNHPPPLASLLSLLLPVGRALEHAHSRGFVHRDVKPDNIFLAKIAGEKEVIPKVLDFGIAKNTLDPDVRLTATHASMGTPLYMAPEQAGGAKDVTPAADQYAFASIVYEALAGAPPHMAETYNALIIAKVTSDPPALLSRRSDVSPELSAVIARALAREPKDRWPSIEALCVALEAFVSSSDAVRASSLPAANANVALLDTIAPGNTTAADGTASAPALDATLDAATPSDTAAPARAPSDVRPANQQPDSAVTTAATTAAPSSKPSRSIAPLAGVVALVAVALVALVALRSPRASSAETPRGGPSAVIDAGARPSAVVFTFEFTPRSAEIELDGVVIGRGFHRATLPVDEQEHVLRVRAEGYMDYRERFVARGPRDISTELTRIPTAVSAPDAAVAAQPNGGRPSNGRSGRVGPRNGRLGVETFNPMTQGH